MKVLTAIIHDTRREKKNKTYPVKIRITYERKQVYYPTRFDLSVDDFSKLFTVKPREEHKKILQELAEVEKKANEIIDELKGSFNWKAFDAKFLKKKSDWNSVFSFYEDAIKKLENEGRISTSESYECSRKSLKEYAEKQKTVSFDDITVDFLNKYEAWMLTNERSITTVGIYLRALRAIYNTAIEAKVISKDSYPFGKNRYEIPTGRNVKKALSLADIGKIYHYHPVNEYEQKARDYWLLSYFGNGINIKDIALLKFKNLQGDFIVFERAKTKRSRRADPTVITIPYTDEVKHIIDRWANVKTSQDDYMFPILEKGIDAFMERRLVQEFTTQTNKGMKRIALKLGIEKDITTYTARHSYATVLKRSGASTEFISEALGHADIKTTKSYLDSFEDEKKKEVAKALTAFKIPS